MSPMAPMSSSSNTMQLNVVETARKYEALVAATFEGNAAGSSRMATQDEVRIETNALFHVPDLRKLFERVHGPLVIRESSAVKGGRATRQPLRFGVYGPATNPECPGDNDAAQDDHDDHGDQDDHCDDQDDLGQAHEPQYQEDTQQHEQYEREETQQHQVQLPAADADSDEPVDDRPISNDAMSEIEVKTNGKSDKIDDAIVSDIEVKAKCDDDYGDEMSGKKSMTGRFLVFAFAFAFAFALVLVMRVIVVIGTTATTCLASVLRWLVFTIVWWIMAVLVPGAVALVVAIVAVISVITGVAFLVLAVANRACTMCIIPLTLAVFHGGVRGGKWCWRTSCQLWGACSATKTVMESSSPSMSESKSKHTSEHKSKKDEGFETATGSETGSEMNRTETRNNVLVHADLAQLFPLSPPATALGTGSASASASASETDSNSESDHERETETETEEETETETEPEMETETEVPVQEVMRSSPPSDQHAAMGLGLIDTVDRSTLSLSVSGVSGVSGSVDAAEAEEEEEEEVSPQLVSRRGAAVCATASAAATATRSVAPVVSSVASTRRRRTFPKGKRINHGLPYGKNVDSVYLKYETQSSSYARNLAGALAARKALAAPSQTQAHAQSQGQAIQASRGWR